MRMLPFFKPKKGFVFAGGGLDTASGGGGGGSFGNITVLEGSKTTSATEETILENVDSFDAIIGVVNAYYSGESRWYRYPIGYGASTTVNARVIGNRLQILFNPSGYTNITYKLFVVNLQTTN